MAMTGDEARRALERRRPRMPLAEVREWEARFGGDDGQDRVLAEVGPAVRARGHFTRDEFLETYGWKTRRTLGRARKYTEEQIADVTGVAFRQDDEKLRVCLLRVLDGVDWPVASTLLHVGCDPSYPILDFRAVWSLGAEVPAHVSFELWWAYVECCRALAAQAGVTVRELDRALWAFSAAQQPAGGA